jgi:3-oxocholest-4-en-26-oyl-CoA dehydrogenase alpha subunit
MDFAYTPEQEALRRDVLAFIEQNVTPGVLADDDIMEADEHGDLRPTGKTGPLMKELYKKSANEAGSALPIQRNMDPGRQPAIP